MSDSPDEQMRTKGRDALGDVFDQISPRLLRMVDFRLDPRLSGRVEPEDVVQEAYLEVSRRLEQFLDAPDVSFFVWVRQITYQCMIGVQRRHFGEKRSPRREVRYRAGGDQSQATFSIARQLVGGLTSPSRGAIREELIQKVREGLDAMDEIDREVLALRHFEHMTNAEVAETLDLSPSAASNRHVRALGRLGEILTSMDGFNQGQDTGQ
jgi:RNA polymerase sigma-70 factor (ECF subfamily)